MSTTDPLTKQDRYRMICEQEIGSLDLIPAMERARRKGVNPVYVLDCVLHKLRCTLKRWEREGRLEPEDNALRQAIEYATRVSFGRWNDAPLKVWLGKWKLELVADRKMRRTK